MHDFITLILSLLRACLALAIGAAVICAAVLLFIRAYAKKSGKPFPLGKCFVWLLLAGYAAAVAFLTLLRPSFGSHLNLTPLRGWMESWNSLSTQGFLNLLLNAALFVPLGFLLPLTGARFRKWYCTVPLGALLSGLIECWQYSMRKGVCDVDDLLMNTLGCALGFCLIMMLFSIRGRRRGQLLRVLGYALLPLFFVCIVAGLAGSYARQPFGNLPDAALYDVGSRKTAWELSCTLPLTGQALPVYRQEPMTRQEADAFAADVARQWETEYTDVNYYDSSAVYQNHSTGDFLTVNFYDRSYTLTRNMDDWDPASSAQLSEDQVLNTLAECSILIPESAQHALTDMGEHVFTVSMLQQDGAVLDGSVKCCFASDGSVRRIQSNLGAFSDYTTSRVITPVEAYTRLSTGYGMTDVQKVTVTDCSIVYRADTKGFYQPLYAFRCTSDSLPEAQTVLIPALRAARWRLSDFF